MIYNYKMAHNLQYRIVMLWLHSDFRIYSEAIPLIHAKLQKYFLRAFSCEDSYLIMETELQVRKGESCRLFMSLIFFSDEIGFHCYELERTGTGDV